MLTQLCTDKKETKVSLYIRKIQTGSGAKSYMTNDLLIYGENIPHTYMTLHMRKGFLIYEEMHKYFHHI